MTSTHKSIILVLVLYFLGLAHSTQVLAAGGYPDWPPDTVSWRIHKGSANSSSSEEPLPSRPGEACYRTLFFGDSICAGFDNTNLLNVIQSFCENMAINYSKINHDALTKYENYSKIGAQSEEILDQMKENKESIKKAHLIAWDAGGNDLLAARKAFSDSEQDETYCRQCFMDNELGNPFATQADPRCKGIVGALQKFKQAHKKTLQFIQKNARADANIRAMGLYYPQMTQNKLTELNCKDPDTGQTYQNLYEVFLPIVAKGIYAALEPVSSARAAGDKRFNAFQALPQFNSKTSEAAQFFNYIPGDSMSYFVKDKILNHQHLLIDPYFESSWVQESQDSSAQLLQTRFLTLNESDIHPSEAGHRLLEKINSEIAYDFAPAPLKITDDLITEEWDCD